MTAANPKIEQKHLRQVIRRQIIGKAHVQKSKRQLKRFKEQFIGSQVIKEEVDEVQVTDAAFFTINGKMAIAEQQKAIKGFARDVSDMASGGRSVIVTAIAFD